MTTACCKCDREDRDRPIVRDGKPYCTACYVDDYTFACAWCEEDVEELDTQHDYVAVFDEEEAGLDLPGFYRVRHKSYVTHMLVGSGWLHAWALQWLGPLPAGLEEPDGYPCGHFCRACGQRMLGLLATKHGLIADVA